MRSISRSQTFLSVLVLLLAAVGFSSNSLMAAGLAQQIETAKLTPSDGATFQLFGFDVAVEGATLAVSAINDNDRGQGAGAVYLFERQEEGEPDEWLQVLKLTASDTAANDGFGTSVVLEGDTLFVGASTHVADGVQSGSVYIFERDAGGPDAWGEVAKLVPSVAGTFDLFGIEIAAQEDVLVVGAIQALNGLGTVYVFQRDSAGWHESAILNAPGPGLFSSFGLGLAVDEDRILVGAPGEFIDNDTRGAAYLFERENGGASGWVLAERFTASADPALGFFGAAVAIEGDLLVSGAFGANFACPSTFFCYSGSVYVFHRDGSGSWNEQPKLIPSDNGPGDGFGFSLSLEGNRLLVGAMCNICLSPGAAYLFERDPLTDANWNEVVRLVASDPTVGALQGVSTALSGELGVAGAHFADGVAKESGAAYLYALPNPAQATIDVLPGSERNPIHAESEGVIPVAILTTNVLDGEDADFNALEVDAHTVSFGPGEAGIAHGRAHAEDVDADGDYDLLMHFAAQDVGLVCGDTSASLSGETFDGEGVSGEDNITIVGCHSKAPSSRGRGGGGPITNHGGSAN